MTEIETMLAKAVKELGNDKVKLDVLVYDGYRNYHKELRLTINGVRVSLFTDTDDERVIDVWGVK